MATPLRVLLIEDEETDALLLLRALKKGGYDVTHTRVLTEADMRAELTRAEWDIIISDYVLPEFSGAQALQVLKESGLQLPFILVSGLIPTEIAVEVVKSSADDYVSKDRLERLVPSVQSALAQAQRRREVAQAVLAPTVRHQWRFGIRARLIVSFGAMALLVGLIGGLSAYWHYREADSHARAVAEQMARAVAIGVRELAETGGTKGAFFDNPTRIQAMIDEAFRSEGRDLEVVDTRMKIVADSVHEGIGTTVTHSSAGVVAQTLKDGITRTFIEQSDEHPAGLRQVVVPLTSDQGSIEGAVITDYEESYEAALAESVREAGLFAVISLLGIGTALGVGHVTGRAITVPLDRLQQAAVRLGQGDLETTIPTERADEVGDLASAFETMRVKLKQTQLTQMGEVDKRVRVETALSASHQTMRTLIDTAPVAILHLTLDGIVRMWNPAAERLFGWREQEVLNRPVPTIPPDKRDEVDAFRERLLRGEIITNYETTRLTKAGAPVDVALSLSPLRDGRNQVTGFISIVTDIGERKRAEEALRQANNAITATVSELERRSEELRLIRDMTDLVQSSTGADEAYDVIQRSLARLCPTNTGALYLLTPGRTELERMLAWGEHAARLTPAFGSEDCWALRRGYVHRARASRGDALCRHNPTAEACEHLCVPMLAHGETLGILHVCRAENDRTPMTEDSFVSLLQALANSIGLSLGNLRLREELRQLSIRDTVTGLFNRRFLDETLRREILRAKRAKSTLGVIMLDIDHFKRFNDTYGHEAGDAVLSVLGEFLQRHVRGEDIVCRFGGEEFTLILPGASLEITRDRAEQLRLGVQLLVVRVADRPLEMVTLSLGVAVLPDHGETADAILQAADAALYRAKRGGRNRVEVAA